MLYQLVVEKQGQVAVGSPIMTDKTMCVLMGKLLRDHPVHTSTNVRVVRARTEDDVRDAVNVLVNSIDQLIIESTK